jgi:class 3 adenylate cyclase
VHGLVDEAGGLTAAYLGAGYPEEQLRQTLAEALLLEDSLFHTIQMVEAGFRQADAWEEPEVRRNILVGVARYLAAHSPTNREREQTVTIALRLRRGEALYADRVLATVMFTDVVDSTARAARLGDSGWRQLLEGYRDAVRRQLASHGGREIDAAGDGILALFDSPARAVRCGWSIVAAVERLGIEVRAGLHAGELEVVGERVAGIGLHIGRRVADLAGAGEVLVSSTVKDLVAGSGIAFEDRGSHRLRGVPEEWHLFAALSQSPSGVAEVVH